MKTHTSVVKCGFYHLIMDHSFIGSGNKLFFSAPGRTELGGNHTDHQHGKVLAAAVDLDTRAVVTPNSDNCIRIRSEGYAPFCISLDALEKREGERGSSASLVRGIAARIRELTGKTAAFDADISSDVLPGSGLSSSAAFEVLIASIINTLADCGLEPLKLAQIGQYAENVYFGKPCGLMDQTASALGGIVAIDFADTAAPLVEKIDFDFSRCGYDLCVIDSGADHADLTEEYAAITEELKKVCAVFGKDWLRQVPEEEFFAHLAEVRAAAGDRAVLRAMHVYAENKRVTQEVEALKGGNIEAFLRLVNASGCSSWMYLQNVIPAGHRARQELALTLALAERLLHGKGAVRVHGGGFAGTVLAFVPKDMTAKFKTGMENFLGKDKCHILSVRQEGSVSRNPSP